MRDPAIEPVTSSASATSRLFDERVTSEVAPTVMSPSIHRPAMVVAIEARAVATIFVPSR